LCIYLRPNKYKKYGKLFITSKLWIDQFGKNRYHDNQPNWGNQINDTVIEMIKSMDVSYLDVLYIHWPFKLDEKKITEEFRISEIWTQFELLVEKGLIKHIGVSNFGLIELQELLYIYVKLNLT